MDPQIANEHDLWSEANRQQIQDLLDQASRLGRAGRTREARAFQRQAADLRAELAKQFASKRGWTVAKTDFGVGQLQAGRPGRSNDRDHRDAGCSGRILDHLQGFRHKAKPYRPVALLTQPYVTPGAVITFAIREQLDFEFLPWSWWNPSGCIAVLLMPPTG